MLLRDSARPHTAVRTVQLWQLLDLPPYNLCLAH
jgi:hypothetical protein